MPSQIIMPDIIEQTPGQGLAEHVVIVYNNDDNTYDQVIQVLMQATACTQEEAQIETWEIDHLGKSVVHHGAEGECERAASVIRSIGLHVEVRQE